MSDDAESDEPASKNKGGHGTSRRPDSQQLVRQWAILKMLSGSGRAFSVKELADQLSTSKTTIQRDLATLEQEFALIEEQVGKQKRTYRLSQAARALEGLTFGLSELLALHAAGSTLVGAVGTPLQDDLRSVILKIRGALSSRHNGVLDAMVRVFQPHARGYVDYAGHGDTVETLIDAIARRHICEIRYHARYNDTTRDHRISPLKLLWHRNALYLLAQIEGKDEISTMAVHRIESIEKTDERFPPSRVDLAEHTRGAFGIFVSDGDEEVEILFDKDIAWRIEERVFHPDEQKERLADGRLRYRVRTSAQWEIVPWVLSFGANAQLVTPPAWREIVAASLAEALRTYE